LFVVAREFNCRPSLAATADLCTPCPSIVMIVGVFPKADISPGAADQSATHGTHVYAGYD